MTPTSSTGCRTRPQRLFFCRLKQNLSQFLRLIQHRDMAARHRKRLPTFRFCLFEERRERGTLPESFSQNVRNVLDLTNTAGEFKRLFEASERMERILSLQPIGICR